VSLRLDQSDYFWADLAKQVDWYRDNASPEIAVRFVDAVEATLAALTKSPGLGRPRFVDWPDLAEIRSWRVNRPFHRHLIFYRFHSETLYAERLIHGARDLPRRLRELPG
jgi:toxin ParE1/3/4